MKIEKQLIENHQALLTVEFDSNVFEDYRRRAARKLAQHVKIPGFRPGKAPYQIVQRYVGDESIAEEAVEILVDEKYADVLKEADVEPSAPGQLKNIKSLLPLTLEFLIPLKAEVELGDYRSIRQPYDVKEISTSEVEEVIHRIQESQAVIEPVDRPVQEGDVVTALLSGERGNAVEGEEKTIIEERSIPINILSADADTKDEWPFPGISRQLVGLAVGDEREFDFTYPEDYQYESMRGVVAQFKVRIEEVKSRTLPEINDDLAKSAGDYADLVELHAAIFKDLETHARDEYHEAYNEQIMDQVIEQSTFKYPPQLMEREVADVVARLENRLKNQGMDMDLYLKSRQMDMDALREEARPVAEKRLKKTLAIMEISDREAIKVEPDELQAETIRTLNQYSQVLSEKEMQNLVSSQNTNNLVGNIMMDLMIDKTMERLRDYARGLDPLAQPAQETEEDEAVADVEQTAQEVIVDEPADTTTAG